MDTVEAMRYFLFGNGDAVEDALKPGGKAESEGFSAAESTVVVIEWVSCAAAASSMMMGPKRLETRSLW